jgi:hypothetical protein
LPCCASLYAGLALSASVGIRNDGWLTWSHSGGSSVTVLIKWMNGTQTVSSAALPLPRDMPSGDGIVVDFTLIPPATPGNYTLHYEMSRGGVAFSSLGDYAWENAVTLVALVNSTPSAVKTLADGAAVTIANAIVTAGTDQLSNKFYIEDQNRCSGIQVSFDPTLFTTKVSVGDLVSVSGILSSSAGERVITSPTLLFLQPH